MAHSPTPTVSARHRVRASLVTGVLVLGVGFTAAACGSSNPATKVNTNSSHTHASHSTTKTTKPSTNSPSTTAPSGGGISY